jgi:hypothetical protein
LKDRKKALLEVLESIRRCYFQLKMLKEYEQSACSEGDYRYLYELSTNERAVVDEIAELMKFVVPDLVYMKREPDIRKVLDQIDMLQEQVIRDTIDVKKNLSTGINLNRKKLQNLQRLPGAAPTMMPSLPTVVNIRA